MQEIKVEVFNFPKKMDQINSKKTEEERDFINCRKNLLHNASMALIYRKTQRLMTQLTPKE